MSGRRPYPWCTWDERDNLDDEGNWEARGALQRKEVYEHFVNDFGGLRYQSYPQALFNAICDFNFITLATDKITKILNSNNIIDLVYIHYAIIFVRPNIAVFYNI